MNAFEVIGGNKLKGEIVPQGAKNEALQILSAVLLTAEPVKVSNIPDILDVNLLIELLEEIGVKVSRTDRHTCTFQADAVDADYLASDVFRKKGGKLRGSVMFAGPMLARFKRAYIPKPGGDKIGRRRLDTHIIGFEKLGAKYEYEEDLGCFKLSSPQLKGTYILLDEPSVTGTANIVMAAVLAEGGRAVFAKQQEILSEVMQETRQLIADFKPTGSAQEIAAKQAELARRAFEATVKNTKDIAELIQQSSSEAPKIIFERMRESVAEARAAIESRKA